MAIPIGTPIRWTGQGWEINVYGGWQPLNMTADQVQRGITSGAFVNQGVAPATGGGGVTAQSFIDQAERGTRTNPAYQGVSAQSFINQTERGAATTPVAPLPAWAIAPNGQPYTIEQLRTLYGSAAAPTAITAPQPQAAAAQAAPERGNNPTATLVNGAWNVDSTVQRAQTAGSPPAAAAATAQTQPGLLTDLQSADYRDPLLSREWERLSGLQAPMPAGMQAFSAGGFVAGEGGRKRPQYPSGGGPASAAVAGSTFTDANGYRWRHTGSGWVLEGGGGGGEEQAYAQGGMTNGMQPNALVGEGMETDNTDLDGGNEFRGEAVWVPTGQPGTYKGYFAEGPVATALPGGTLIHPVSTKNEETFRARLLPIDQMPAAKEEQVGGDLAAYRGGGVVPMPGMRPPMPQRPALYGDGGGMRGAA